ncbi:thioredoxin-like protein 4A isoform X2 [Ornithorhynchus anatinus]|uniref:thioredoxin-like protein 4A isoform X2 n=1 Tax=Ornithorhynchus anatinus TaxID=9258 RepID=UPI0007AA782F|nr:thioredoxin-like protein 4A isoform X2 [Ornithorhynchus anatinus]
MADGGGAPSSSSGPRATLGWPSCWKVKNFAVIYLVDITEVPDFNKMYELYDPCTVMFFFRNKHIMIDLGTGNNNKINWAMEDKQEMIDIIETVYRGARKGRGLVVSPKDYSTKYRY